MDITQPRFLSRLAANLEPQTHSMDAGLNTINLVLFDIKAFSIGMVRYLYQWNSNFFATTFCCYGFFLVDFTALSILALFMYASISGLF